MIKVLKVATIHSEYGWLNINMKRMKAQFTCSNVILVSRLLQKD